MNIEKENNKNTVIIVAINNINLCLWKNCFQRSFELLYFRNAELIPCMSTLIFWNVWPFDRPPTAGIRGGTGSNLPVAHFEKLSNRDAEDDGSAKFRMPILFQEDMDDELRGLARQANSKTSWIKNFYFYFFAVILIAVIFCFRGSGQLQLIAGHSVAITSTPAAVPRSSAFRAHRHGSTIEWGLFTWLLFNNLTLNGINMRPNFGQLRKIPIIQHQ